MEGGEQVVLNQAPKKNGGSIAIIVICAVLALGGVGFGIFGMIQANTKETVVSENAKGEGEKSTETNTETECNSETSVVPKDINAGQDIKVYNYVATKDDTRYILRLSQHESDGEKKGYFEIATIGVLQSYSTHGYVGYADGKIVLSEIYDDETRGVMDETADALGFKWAKGEELYKKVEASFDIDSITLGATKFEGINK